MIKTILLTLAAVTLLSLTNSAGAALFPAPTSETSAPAPAPMVVTHHIHHVTPTSFPPLVPVSVPQPPAAQPAPSIIPGFNLNQALGFGGTFVGGGVLGFAVGYALKKIVKLALIVLGLFIAGLAILQNKGIVSVNWAVTQNTANDLAKQGASQISAALNTASAGLHTTHLDILYPALGIVGFMPGVVVGFKMG